MIHIGTITEEVIECSQNNQACSTLLASKKENHISRTYGNTELKQKLKPKRKQRIKKALEILNNEDFDIIQIDKVLYRVRSQSDSEKFFTVKIFNEDLHQCECEDYVYTSHKLPNNECKHIMAARFYKLTRPQLLLNKPQVYNPKTIYYCSSSQYIKCPDCGKIDFKKAGTTPLKCREEKQKYYCKTCDWVFQHKDGFEFLKFSPKIIARAIDLVCRGLSYHNAQDEIAIIYGKKMTHQTIINMMKKCNKLLLHYTSLLNPRLSDTWLADETDLKVKDCVGTGLGKYMKMWNLYDRGSKMWITTFISAQKEIKDAINFFETRKKTTDIIPKVIMTDSNSAYPNAVQAAFPRNDLFSEPPTIHIQYLSIKHSPNNNPIERLHGTIKDLVKSRRGLGNAKSAQIFSDILRIYYNFCRIHSALGNKTPAEAAGINLNLGDDKLYGLLILAGKQYVEDHRFREPLRRKRLLRQIKFEDKYGSIFVTTEYRPTDLIWKEINKIMLRFGFEWKKVENKTMWVKKCSLNQKNVEGNQNGK
jgi:transposase-like protein